MQGYAIEHDKPFTYRKSFTVPVDYAGKHTILRFDGVYSHARLFVNGTFVREHHGGFTRWETDVTPFVRTRKEKRDSPRSDGSPGRYFLCLRLCPSSDRGNPARCNLVRITRNLLV